MNLYTPEGFWEYVRNTYGSAGRDPLHIVLDGAKILVIFRALTSPTTDEYSTAQAMRELDSLARGES